MLSDPECDTQMAPAADLGTFEPHLYRVVSVHHA